MPYSTLFRSEEMSLIQLYIPSEIAQPTVAELGELGLIQFRDLNPDVNAFQRAFVSEIRRYDEMERHLRFFEAQITKSDIPVRPLTGINARVRNAQEVDDLEDKIREHERRISQMNSSYETLQKRYLELTEARHVLKETAVYFEEAVSRQDNIRHSFDEPSAPLLDQDVEQGGGGNAGGGESQQMTLGFVTGVITRSRMQTFERILWRALRGNLYLNSAEIDELITDPETDEVLEKNVFIIFAHGKEILNKIKKISESLGATLYPVDDSSDKRQEHYREVNARIEDLNSVLQNTNNARRAELLSIADELTSWTTLIKKEKAIYHTMNLFNYDANRKCLIAEGWCPSNDINLIQQALRTATEESGTTVPTILHELRTSKEPPTYHRLNKFTSGFQEIVDAYGVAKYREVNPGLFTIITFPFLFAVMFGDFGHGIMVTLFALYLVIFEKKLASGKSRGEIFEMFFGGRYIILLMGIFSIYTGLIYNDVFSQPMHLAASGWKLTDDPSKPGKLIGQQTGVYPIGVDPVWHGSENFLLFTNSYKMKMSIILGVIQMSFDAIYAIGNPRVSPPGLLNLLIYMFLQPGHVDKDVELYSGQGTVQLALIGVAVLCIPWMLFTKPLILRHENNEHGGAIVAEEMHEEEEFDFGEVMIHQVIHTIEFCLGCISNTASYLRLWALSLAHAQLSAVLFDMTLKGTIHPKNALGYILLIITAVLWFVLTVGILLLMEGLSAFLHALRLHWVEFNNKFYEGTGRKFMPFSFKHIFKDSDDE
ncbi:V-type ATPase, V0 complex, 116kDa subunit family [Rhizophagus clarus]|uniref:V-type proton ATPase subunit a n=1 Tax=Rhizophagus clarus TaxID=94130 RepID=A0A8H3QIV4_9GLOM|nr:V-type ATPase, V0 complex, 116kDa subunit family [Rhizophagus clarus]